MGGAAVTVMSTDTAEPESLWVAAPPPKVAVELAALLALAVDDDMASEAREERLRLITYRKATLGGSVQARKSKQHR